MTHKSDPEKGSFRQNALQPLETTNASASAEINTRNATENVYRQIPPDSEASFHTAREGAATPGPDTAASSNSVAQNLDRSGDSSGTSTTNTSNVGSSSGRHVVFSSERLEGAITEEDQAQDDESDDDDDDDDDDDNRGEYSNTQDTDEESGGRQGDEEFGEEIQFPNISSAQGSTSSVTSGPRGTIPKLESKRPLRLKSLDHWRRKSVIRSRLKNKMSSDGTDPADGTASLQQPALPSDQDEKDPVTVQAKRVGDGTGEQHFSRLNPKVFLSRVTGHDHGLKEHTESLEMQVVEQQPLIKSDQDVLTDTTNLNDDPPNVHFVPGEIEEQERNDNNDRNPAGRRQSLAKIYNDYMDVENVPGFVGLAAIALAEIPSPEKLLAKARFKRVDEEARIGDADIHTYEPTPAADIQFVPEHTFREIQRRRLQTLRYLALEYMRLGIRYILTPKGFAVTVYFLLIVAFGGMLFLLLLNAAPAMSREWGPDDKVHSPRQIWIEIDSQILNALFCVTGLGLFPKRVRDLYMYLVGTYRKDSYCRRKVLRAHSDWFLNDYSSEWKLLTVLLLYIMNSVFQVLLCVVMWHFNRFTRPSWTTGTLIAAAFSCVIIAGIITFVEARRVKTLGVLSRGTGAVIG